MAVVEESGVNEAVTTKFPGSEVKVGSAASGAGDNREIPLDEGGDIDRRTGRYVGIWQNLLIWYLRVSKINIFHRPTKARDFEGEGGPEDKAALYAEANPGNDDVGSNVRQQKEPKGEPVPAAGVGKAHSAMDQAV